MFPKLCASAMLLCLTAHTYADHIWINEIHYDNAGADANEQVEVVIRTPNGSGATAANYALEFYNGSNGDLYATSSTLDMFGTINSTTAGPSTFTFYTEFIPSIQNGSPDGIALVDVINNTVVSFLSYEGAFTADADNGGIAGAAGTMSTDIGVAEGGATTDMQSLGLVGAGMAAADFTWAADLTQTPGAPNMGQVLVPEPAELAMIGLAGVALCGRRRR